MSNIVSLHQESSSPPPQQTVTPNRSVGSRWTDRLGKSFCPVSSYFLANYHRLKPHPGAAGLNSTAAMFIIQLMDFKWDEKAPHPSLGTIALRMGIGVRQLRSIAKNLEELGYIQREFRTKGQTSRYHFNGLFKALEELMASDIAKEGE